ncbi:MAG: JDVT-CTERM system glutamic-type intramembrane protease [Myxococcota bacterium]
MAATEEPDLSGRRALREGLWAAGFLLLLLGLLKPLAASFPGTFTVGGVSMGLPDLVFTVAVGFQLYFPLERVGHRGVSYDRLGLRRSDLWGEARAFAGVSLATGLLYGVGFHFWMSASGRSFDFSWPDRFLERLAVEVLVIALAEEMFFRGYLQERLSQGMPPQRKFWGISLGWAWILTSAIFALAHFIGEYRPTRLGPFFPGLVFGALRARAHHLWAAVLYHAFCNLLADVLGASYH